MVRVLSKAFGFIPYLFSYRRKVFKIRKKYDRLREKADKQKNAQKRLSTLKILDNAERILVMLEEQRISRFERGRMMRQVKVTLADAKANLEQSEPLTPSKQKYRY